MSLEVLVNGAALAPGASIEPGALDAAGMVRVTVWRRLLRRLARRHRHWEAADPRITIFDGQVEIYPCRHGYLDPDRRWGTACLVSLEGARIAAVELRVIEGVYAASNLFDRFVEAATERIGPPQAEGRRQVRWRAPSGQITAELDPDLLNATFRLFRANDELTTDGPPGHVTSVPET